MEVFGVPANNDIVEPSMDIMYGFAYYFPRARSWSYYVGNFLFLYGLYTTFVEKTDIADEDDFAIGLFHLNAKYRPIDTIHNIRINAALSRHVGRDQYDAVLTDLSFVEGNVPRINFII